MSKAGEDDAGVCTKCGDECTSEKCKTKVRKANPQGVSLSERLGEEPLVK